MPGLDGVATLRELRKIDLDVPIYIVTAFHAEFLDKLKSAAKDGLDFQILEKPIGRDQIIYLANGLLEGAMECHPRGEQDV
jgi:CheY-like chemotaxis protein